MNRKNKNPYIIAEVGTSHGGSLDKAKELILAAKESGANGVKFQIIYADEIVHPLAGHLNLPGGKTDIFAAFKKVEQTPDFFKQLNEYCHKIQIDFIASAFGPKSLKEYQELNLPYFKLASPELNYYPLLEYLNQTQMQVILSTGVSTTKDILNAVAYLKNPAAVLHCITTYPAPEKHCNLKWLTKLAQLTQLPVGLSDHTRDPELAPLVAVRYGATIIEKHLRLEGAKEGLDDPFALSPSDFSKMTHSLNAITHLSPEELEKSLISLFGKKRFTQISGKPQNKLISQEKKIYKTTNRSWVALTHITKGEILTPQNCACLRSEINHFSGLQPQENQLYIYGSRCKKTTKAGYGILSIDN